MLVAAMLLMQAHVAPVGSVEEVHAMVEVLRQNKKIRAATHNIMAYRWVERLVSIVEKPRACLPEQPQPAAVRCMVCGHSPCSLLL
jgi:hypothetical protein